VDNCVSHAYKQPSEKDYIYLSARLYDNGEFSIEISDNGCGFDNVQWHIEPMHTTSSSNEHCGMGFTVMQSFMDSVDVKSKIGKGTTILMRKKLRG
jgi:stage II sporulation protein AB (anti-sigma F factor)